MRAELSDDRVRLRRPRAGDAPLLLEAVTESHGELSRWMSWCRPGYSADDSAEWLKSCAEGWDAATQFDFLITEPGGGVLAGVVGLNQINRVNGYANLGYWVRTGKTGRGLASAAARLAARFGLAELGLHRVEIVAAVGNEPSQRVALKAGAMREGVLRNRLLLHSRPHDAVMFSLTPADMNIG